METESDKENAFFDDIIVYDCAENKRSAKTTPQQYEKLKRFMDKNPDFTKGRASEKQLHSWDKLCGGLNKIGPPSHSSIVWRRVWTDFKAAQKRNRRSKTIVRNSKTIVAKTSRKKKQCTDTFIATSLTVKDGQNRSQTSEVQLHELFEDRSNDKKDTNEVSSNCLKDKFEERVDNVLTELTMRVDVLINEQMVTNNLLRELIDTLKPQSLDD